MALAKCSEKACRQTLKNHTVHFMLAMKKCMILFGMCLYITNSKLSWWSEWVGKTWHENDRRNSSIKTENLWLSIFSISFKFEMKMCHSKYEFHTIFVVHISRYYPIFHWCLKFNSSNSRWKWWFLSEKKALTLFIHRHLSTSVSSSAHTEGSLLLSAHTRKSIISSITMTWIEKLSSKIIKEILSGDEKMYVQEEMEKKRNVRISIVSAFFVIHSHLSFVVSFVLLEI